MEGCAISYVQLYMYNTCEKKRATLKTDFKFAKE